MTEEEKRRQSGTVPYVPTYGEFAAAQNAGKAASNIAAGIMPVTYAQGGAYTPAPAATPPAATYGTGAAGGTMPTTPTTTPTTTTYGENVDGLTVRQMIEQQRQASYADAEKLRERSVIDASTAYAQNKATYGANAEALAGMGLTGGGYGDYLNSRAYAQQREEIQAARAGEAAAKREADRVYYADMMVQKEKEDVAAKADEQTQKNIYLSLLEAAKSGAYSGEEIRELANSQGYTNESDITWLASRADVAKADIETSKAGTAYIEILAQAKTGNYTADDIRNIAAKKGITDTADIEALAGVATTAQSNIQSEKDAAAAEKKNASYATLLDAAKSGAYTADEIKALAGKMGITNEADLTALGNAASTAKTEASDKANNAAYIDLLDAAKSGNYTADEIRALAAKSGLTNETDINTLASVATTAQSNIQSEKDAAAAEKKNAAYATLLDAAKSGAYTADEIKALAGKMGITNEADLTALGNAASTAKTEASDKANNAAYIDLLDAAKSGNYTADEIRALAAKSGLTNETDINTLASVATTAQSNIQSEKDAAAADRQSAAYIELLGEAKTGAFTADEIKSMAGALGITDETKLTNLATAASDAQTAISDKEATSEVEKQNAAYVELLAEAKKGTFTADEIKSMAGALGITDETKLTNLATAATTAQSNIKSEKDAAVAEKKNASYATLLDAAKSGAYTADEIKALAGKMGITNEADLASLGNAASTAYNAADTKNKNSSYVSLLDAAKGGNYTEEEIRDVAKKMGLSDADINTLANAAKTTREANERENISGNISADTTDEEISNMIISGELSESNREAAEKARTEAAADEISALVDAKNYEGADALVEKYYSSGAYDKDERQNYYMEKTLDFIDKSTNLTGDIASLANDIVKLKNDGKISETDYRNAMQYLSERAVSAYVPGKDVSLHDTAGSAFEITINGVKYSGRHSLEPSNDAGGNIQNILDNMMGGYPTEGSTALYDDGVYIYMNFNGKKGWYKASRNFFSSGLDANKNKKIYEALQGIAMHRPTPTRPEHKAAK